MIVDWIVYMINYGLIRGNSSSMKHRKRRACVKEIDAGVEEKTVIC